MGAIESTSGGIVESLFATDSFGWRRAVRDGWDLPEERASNIRACVALHRAYMLSNVFVGSRLLRLVDGIECWLRWAEKNPDCDRWRVRWRFVAPREGWGQSMSILDISIGRRALGRRRSRVGVELKRLYKQQDRRTGVHVFTFEDGEVASEEIPSVKPHTHLGVR